MHIGDKITHEGFAALDISQRHDMEGYWFGTKSFSNKQCAAMLAQVDSGKHALIALTGNRLGSSLENIPRGTYVCIAVCRARTGMADEDSVVIANIVDELKHWLKETEND